MRETIGFQFLVVTHVTLTCVLHIDRFFTIAQIIQVIFFLENRLLNPQKLRINDIELQLVNQIFF